MNFDMEISLKEMGIIMLPITGTLLGLVYAGLIYWLDSALAKLRYSGAILENSIVADGRLLLDLLVGASLVIDHRGN